MRCAIRYLYSHTSKAIFLMLIAREEYIYYSSYFIKLFQQIANDVIATIKQQNLLFLTTRTLNLYFVYIKYMLNFLNRFIISSNFFNL